MIDIKRRGFLFGAVATLVAPPVRSFFLMPKRTIGVATASGSSDFLQVVTGQSNYFSTYQPMDGGAIHYSEEGYAVYSQRFREIAQVVWPQTDCPRSEWVSARLLTAQDERVRPTDPATFQEHLNRLREDVMRRTDGLAAMLPSFLRKRET